MGIISREGTAPIVDGETASGTEIETEIAKIHTLVNGNIDTNNINSAAGIVGSQLANGTITETQISPSSITTASMATSATVTADIRSGLGADTPLTSSTVTWSSIVNLGLITLTPGSTSDVVLMDCTVNVEADTVGESSYDFGFEIDGATPTLRLGHAERPDENDFGPQVVTVHFSWMYTPGSTSSLTLRPMHIGTNVTNVSNFPNAYTNVFRAWVFPIK